MEKVVITGMGCVTPIANNVKDYHEAQLAGKSGVGTISRFDVSDFPTKIAGEVKLDLSEHFDRKEAKRLDRFVQYALIAATEAFENSGLDLSTLNLERVGTLIGSGIGGMESLEANFEKRFAKSALRVSPFFIPMMIANMASSQVAIRYGFMGPSTATVTACTSGSDAIGNAMRMIQFGEADVVLAGGSEALITPIALGGFSVMRALSTRNDAPETASRPFSATRDGFVLGEGAGVMVLESLSHAEARSANILAELKAFGRSSDAHHMAEPHPEGKGAALAMGNALRESGLNSEDIGYINAHATSTPAGDKAEAGAIKKVFSHDVAVSSTKSMTGHLLGAAGAIEAIACVQAIQSGVLPPSINFDEADPEVPLNVVANEAQETTLNYAMSNSFGFGGQNASLIMGKL